MQRVLDVLRALWIVAFALIAGAAFILAFPDKENNTFHAGLIALCMANVLLMDALRGGRWLQALGALGGIAGSFLWTAKDAEASPADPQFLGLLLLLVAVGLIAAFALIPVLTVRMNQNWRDWGLALGLPILLIAATLYLAYVLLRL